MLTEFSLFVSSGIKNIDWILPAEQIEPIHMVTLTENKLYKIDESILDVVATPALIEGSLINLTLNKEEGKVGENTKFAFSVTTQNKIPLLGKI